MEFGLLDISAFLVGILIAAVLYINLTGMKIHSRSRESLASYFLADSLLVTDLFWWLFKAACVASAKERGRDLGGPLILPAPTLHVFSYRRPLPSALVLPISPRSVFGREDMVRTVGILVDRGRKNH